MNLFRGTPAPESAPELRDHPCVFFAWRYVDVVDFATGGEQAPEGYVQEYHVDDDRRILDLDADPSLAERFSDRPLTESEIRELLHYPPKQWVALVKRHGYDGIAGADYLCLFDVKEARLLRRWRLEYKESAKGYERTLVHGRQ